MSRPLQHVLVAGGDGFIGRHLCQALHQRGAQVVVIDDHSTSRAAVVPWQVIEDDVATVELTALPPLDAVIHLASPAAPHLFAQNPLAVINPNTLGTARLIELARRARCRMLYASSSEVYGQASAPVAFREDHLATHQLLSPRSVYGAAKRLGEELICAARHSGSDATSLRLFNVYGSGMDPTMGAYARVIPSFVRAALDGRPLPIHGSGHQVRAFTFIDDAVAGILRLLMAPGALPPAVNLGHDEVVSINQLAELVEQSLGITTRREQQARSPDDTDWRCPDLQLLSATVAWKPTVRLAEGLAQLVADEVRTRKPAPPTAVPPAHFCAVSAVPE